MGLLCGESRMIPTSTVFDWHRRTSDRRTIAYCALQHICCRALKIADGQTYILS